MSDLFSIKPSVSLKCTVELDEISKEIANAFDYAFDGTQLFSAPAMPELPEKFGIGVIVGASGSGKSTLLNCWVVN